MDWTKIFASLRRSFERDFWDGGEVTLEGGWNVEKLASKSAILLRTPRKRFIVRISCKIWK